MGKHPIRLGHLHIAILMRLYIRAGAILSKAKLCEELEVRTSAADVSAALDDLISAHLAAVEGSSENPLVTLTANGKRYARMWLDAAALTDANLVTPSTSAARFLDYFDRPRKGFLVGPSRWQLFRLSLKWWFRRDWNPARP